MIWCFSPWMIHSHLSPLLIWVFGCCSSPWPLQKRAPPPLIQWNWVMYRWCKAGPPHSLGEPDQSSCCTCARRPPLASTQTCFWMCWSTRREQHKHTDTGAHVHVSAVSTLQKYSFFIWTHSDNNVSAVKAASRSSSCVTAVTISIEMNLRLSGEWPCSSSYLKGEAQFLPQWEHEEWKYLGSSFL